MKPLAEMIGEADLGSVEELSALTTKLAEELAGAVPVSGVGPTDRLDLLDAHFANAIRYAITLSFDVLREVRRIQALIAEMVGASDEVDVSIVDEVDDEEELALEYLTFDRLSRVYDLVQKASASKLIVP